MHLLRGLLVIATRYPRLSQPARAVITQRWSRQLLHILAIKVRVHGTPPAVYPANTLVVANHVSWLDIFALNSVTVSRFVAKKELRDWPLAGSSRTSSLRSTRCRWEAGGRPAASTRA